MAVKRCCCNGPDNLIVCLWNNREEKQKEREAEAHKRWLQERQEKKIELERAWKPPGMLECFVCSLRPSSPRGTSSGLGGAEEQTVISAGLVGAEEQTVICTCSVNSCCVS